MRLLGLIVCNLLTSAVTLWSAPSVNSFDQKIQGIEEPFRSAEISPEISGRIVEISIPEGKIAHQGDTIIKIEYTEDYLVSERARMVAENKADLKSARLKMETAKLEYDAIKLVYDSTNAVSEEELWGKKYQYEAALAEFEQLSGQKEREQIEYRIAQSRLKTHFIIAPYQCVIAAIKLREYEHCKVAEPLVSVVDATKCRLITYVPINVTRNLFSGKKVKMQVVSKNGPLMRNGIVEFLSPVVDPSSDLLTVKIIFDNSDGSVKPGVSGFLLIGE
jgi:RND family efflux transporter MFP subunit